ncbi:dihydroxyacetone kinase subunit DhaK, partial [Microbacterium ulmi]
MTPLANVSADYALDALAGFAAANADRVLPVRGGVVRATASPPAQVAIVTGGGSGHFPAFAGWVGTGFAHGAACGNVFASPSTAQILSVARAADNGGGVLFAPINYAGDILNFGAAAERLRGDDVDVRLVPITDDIASGGAGEHETRRGIAGSFVVLKVAGAAAERGDTLAEVARIASDANAATRTLGVAFSGCTLPGAQSPLFDVPRGRVAIGLGIHGEPGLSEVPLGTADDVADLVVDRLFAERSPIPGGAVAVVVNGLGSTKYDELFIVFSRVRVRLESEGMRLVAPAVGEYVTSLDMAGLSVSLTYLDDELESLWRAPADAAAFTRGVTQARPARGLAASTAPAAVDVGSASEASR